MEAEFLEAMTQTVTVERHTGEDAWGNRTYGVPAQFPCRIDGYTRNRGRGQIQDNTVTGEDEDFVRVITDTHDFSTYDRFTLPGNVQPTVVSVETLYDEDGPHHQVVLLEESRR